jgi:UDP-N-acetylmuramoylalanine--D-glutamate ligase
MKKDLHKIKFSVLGAGRSGLAVAKLLKKNGASVFLSEGNEIHVEVQHELKSKEIEFEFGAHSYSRILDSSDYIVISPGILLSHDLLIEARIRGIPIVSEIEVASWFLPSHAKLVCITGTNGKSTTTSYLESLLKSSGRNAIACGNIGTPF